MGYRARRRFRSRLHLPDEGFHQDQDRLINLDPNTIHFTPGSSMRSGVFYEKLQSLDVSLAKIDRGFDPFFVRAFRAVR